MTDVVTRTRSRPQTLLALPLACGLLILLAAIALLASLWTPYPVDAPDMAVALEGPSGVHWLGTDPAGRDELSLLMKGLLTSFAIPWSAVVLAAIVALPLGLAAVRWRGLNRLLGAANEMLVLFPAIFAALLFATLWSAAGMTAALALAVGNVAPLSIAMRDAVGTFRSHGAVEAARLAGLSRSGALRQAWPQIVNLIGAQAMVLFGLNAALEASLSYLGLGVQVPAHSFGLLLRDAQSYLGAKPLLAILPGLTLTVTIAASVLAAHALREQARRGGSVGAA